MNAALLFLATLPGASYDLDARAALALASAKAPAVKPTLCSCGPGCQCPPGVCPACPTPAPVVLPPIRRVFQPAPVYRPFMSAMPAPFMGGLGGGFGGGFAPGGC